MDNIGMSAIKYLLFFFNLIFAVSGIGIIAAGGIVLNAVGPFSHFMESRILAPPVILIIIGLMIFLIASLGCYGAIKENFTLLMAFAIALVTIFLIKMGIGIAAAVFNNNFEAILKETLITSLHNNSDADKSAWAQIQSALQCCGVNSKDDWTGTMPEGTLPQSCCTPSQSDEESQCEIESEHVYPDNCFNLLSAKVSGNAKVLIGVGIGVAFVEIAGIVLACCLAMATRRENSK